MARSLVFGNGRLHISLDEFGLVHDIYFPYVGLENQLPPHGLAHKIGVFDNGQLTWLDDGSWSFSAQYHQSAMIGYTVATNEALGLRLEFTDAVDTDIDGFFRSIHVVNLKGTPRAVTLYCHQVFMLGDSASSDSALYRPDLAAIMHYKGERVFLASLNSATTALDDYSIGAYDLATGAGTYRDAEDGVLAKNNVENGRVDSVMGLRLDLQPYDSVRASYVFVASETVAGGEAALSEVAENGVTHYIARTAASWQEWCLRARFPKSRLSHEQELALERSLFVIKAHCDERGAVMASLDSSLRDHPQDDAYNFCWPRDAAYALWPLIRLGYTDEALRFFDFVKDGLHEDGYVYHKYRADGSLGSTWLPYVHPDGSVHPPIQADETASVLFLLGQYYRHTGDQAFLTRYYESLIEPMANFLAGHVYEDGLPLPSYDLWEHSYLTHSYTTAVTYASLLEAAELAAAYGRSADNTRWQAGAEKMQSASSCFYNSAEQYFYKGFSVDEAGARIFDATLDSSSLFGVFMYGLFPLESDELTQSLQTAHERLAYDSLYSRFIGDDYYGEKTSPNIWPLVSLWMAEILLERDDIAGAEAIINAVTSLGSQSGLLPEQVRRGEKTPASLSPLVWTHAELISTLIDYVQAKRVNGA